MKATLKKWIPTNKLFVSLASLLLAFFVGGVLLALSGYNPFVAYGTMLQGAFWGGDHIADTLGIATPLILCGVGVAIAMLGGVINIGCEGQLYIGAMAAALCGTYGKGLPAVVHIPLCILAAMLGGGLWAGLAGFLKNKTKANEVVLTIMMNYIGIYLTDYLTTYWFKAEGMVVKTPNIQDSAVLPALYPHSRLTIGFLIALVMVLLTRWMLKSTKFGFETQALGQSRLASETAGVSVGRQFLMVMLLSGAMAGLAGGLEVLGVHKYFIKGFSPGYGYDGLSIAVLGQNSPVGVLLSAVLYGALRSGAQLMDRTTKIPNDFVVVMQALVIIFVATPGIVMALKSRLPKQRPAKEGKANG